jgi:DNA-binding Lrp family transcriptional regulator
MDEVDLRICQLLFANSRIPQRELADQLGLGAAVTHRRLQTLVEDKVIRRFTTTISRSYLHAVAAQVDGVCNCGSVEGSLDKLQKIGPVNSVLTSSSNLTSMTLVLRNIDELGPSVEQICKILVMPLPRVTISMRIFVGMQPLEKDFTGDRELGRLDYRIINALHHNSRKPVNDLAEEIDITPKTARYHLEMMEKEGSIEYGVDWDPSRTAGMSFIVRIDLKPGADRFEMMNRINERFGARFILTFLHSNMPDYVCGYCWAPTVGAHNDLMAELKKDALVREVRSGILHDHWGLETWRDRLIKERAAQAWTPKKSD